jgi:mannonate dehydratase
MKIGLNFYPDFENLPLEGLKEGILNRDNLRFASQIGVTHIIAWMPLPPGNGYWEYDDLAGLKNQVESHGLVLEAIENLPPVHYDRILLGSGGRDKQIENISKTLSNMGRAGIGCLGYFFSITGYWGHWRTGEKQGGRGGAGVTSFDSGKIGKQEPVSLGEFWGNWKTDYHDPEKKLDPINREMMWDRLVYFLDRIIPAAEDAGVRLCIHPADPPAPSLRGIERIMNNPGDFKKLIKLFPSKYHGVEFCQGTFAEMEGVGAKVIDLIRYFGKRKKIFYVHFRNVRGTYPKFDEAFIDEGDVPMLEALKAYRDVGFNGVIIPDHVPVLNTVSEPWHSGMSYSVGYIKAAMQALNII